MIIVSYITCRYKLIEMIRYLFLLNNMSIGIKKFIFKSFVPLVGEVDPN